jgi:hypothetical protein
MATEELYVNVYNVVSEGWSVSGANPYLQSGDGEYISSRTNGALESNFGFANSAGSGTINSVKLRLRDKIQNLDSLNTYTVEVYDGSSWTSIGSFAPAGTSFANQPLKDVSAILNTWAKINACLIRLTCNRVDNYYVYVSAASRVVDYTVVAGGQQLFTLINQEDY